MSAQKRKTKPRKRAMSETEYLLSSPKNARRLMASLKGSQEGKGLRMTLEELRRFVGLSEK